MERRECKYDIRKHIVSGGGWIIEIRERRPGRECKTGYSRLLGTTTREPREKIRDDRYLNQPSIYHDVSSRFSIINKEAYRTTEEI